MWRNRRVGHGALGKPVTARQLARPFKNPTQPLQEPTDKFALALTRNAFPGAPIRVGKKRVAEPKIQAVVVNNKVRAARPSGRPFVRWHGNPDGD